MSNKTEVCVPVTKQSEMLKSALRNLTKIEASRANVVQHANHGIQLDEFLDNFEDPITVTDCESFTTDTTSVVMETDVTSSPVSLFRRGYQAELNSESDSWSITSSFSNLPQNRGSPDGESLPGDVDATRKTLRFDYPHPQSPCETDKFPLFLPLSRPLLSFNRKRNDHVIAEMNSIELNHQTSEETLSVFHTMLGFSEISFTNSVCTSDQSDAALTMEHAVSDESSVVADNNLCDVPRSKPPINVSSPKLVTVRSHSLPNELLRSWSTNFRMLSTTDPPNVLCKQYTHTNDLIVSNFHKFDNRSTDTSASTSNSSTASHLRCPRRGRHFDLDSHGTSGSQVLYSHNDPRSPNKRKHLPNPFNKLNHRFHSTLHCPCFLFFCFLCCYPGVYLMQRSDIQFISGEDDLARSNGKKATVLYIVGGVCSVVLLSTMLFLMYYFVGEDLIKAKDS